MAKNSAIEWTHHTFNPWWGCQKVSAACKHCYAQTWAKRVGGSNLWGARSTRRTFTDKHWNEPLRWNREAEADQQRRRVFCASMADWAEDRTELIPWRERLYNLIDATPWLDWLLLTKRISRVTDIVPWGSDWPENVWLGTTIERQDIAISNLPIMVDIPAKIRFLSCEPLLGPLDLQPWLANIDWVIAGGESGPKARPMHPDWPRFLRDQCRESNTAFHFKQWGNWFPVESTDTVKQTTKILLGTTMANIGKKRAGRLLDGREWNGLPEASAA